MVSPQCELFDDIQAGLSMQRPCHNGCIDMVSLQSEFYDGFMSFCCESLVTLVTVIYFLLSVRSLMSLKITFL